MIHNDFCARYQLTWKQRETLRLLMDGNGVAGIAKIRGVSKDAVSVTLAAILKKVFFERNSLK